MGLFDKRTLEQERQAQSIELQKAKAEAEKLRTESANRRQINQEREELKQTRAELQALKAELHPSVFSKLKKGISEIAADLSKGKYKKAHRRHRKHKKIVRTETSHAHRRRKQLRSMI